MAQALQFYIEGMFKLTASVNLTQFDYEGTGLSFSQDASFLVLAAPVTPIKYDYPIANGCDNKHSSSCDQWGDRIHIPSAIDNPETSLSLKIDVRRYFLHLFLPWRSG